MTFSCSEPQIVPITFASASRSYLLLPGTAQIDGLSVSFQFRTWNKDGLLLFTELSENSGHLLVYLHGGRLMLLIQKETENPVEITEGVYFFFFLFTFTCLLLKHKGSACGMKGSSNKETSNLPFSFKFSLAFQW